MNPATNPIAALTTLANGAPWQVTYYQQVLGASDEPSAHDVNRKAPFQQYNKILQLEILVTQTLSQHQKPDSKEFEVTGAAIAYGFLKPNVGDTFVAQVDDGRMAIFNVTSSTQTSFQKGTNFLIEYTLVTYTDPVLVGDLDKKSINTYQFVKSLLSEGQYPLMSTSAYAVYGGLGKLYTDLVSVYFRDFFSVERQTLLVPDQPYETYDPYVTKAMVDLVGADENLRLPRVRLPMTGGDLATINVTVWDALLKTNLTELMTGIQRAGIAPTIIFRNIPFLTGIYYTGIEQIVYPKDKRTDMDARYGYVEHPPIGPYFGDGTPRYKELSRLFAQNDEAFFKVCCKCVEDGDAGGELPAIVPVTQDDYYVFTAGFYGSRNTQMASQLEVLVRNAIETQSVDNDQLTALGTASFTWPNLERYYYVPALIALIKLTLQANPSPYV